jgi:hypothetical protein
MHVSHDGDPRLKEAVEGHLRTRTVYRLSPSMTLRQAGVSFFMFACRQVAIARSSLIPRQSRSTSGLQARCCCGVPKWPSSAAAMVGKIDSESARTRVYRFMEVSLSSARMPHALAFFASITPAPHHRFRQRSTAASMAIAEPILLPRANAEAGLGFRNRRRAPRGRGIAAARSLSE